MLKHAKPSSVEERVVSMFNQGTISYQTDLLKFDFGLAIEDYFKSIQPLLLKSSDSRTDNEKEVIYCFMSYFKDFLHLISNLNGGKYQEILKTLIGYMTCAPCPSNKIVLQQGDKANKVLLMLSGTAEVIMPKRFRISLTINDYYRYLAKLIVFKEYELLSKVLFENSQVFPLEVLDCGSFGRINGFRMNCSDQAVNVKAANNLEKFLTNEDRKLIARLSKSRIRNSLNYLEVSTKDYIERIEIAPSLLKLSNSNCKVFTSHRDEHFTEDLNDTLYSLFIYKYITKGVVNAGQSINDIALVNPKSIRVSTIISSSPCYLCIINRDTYLLSVKKTNSRCNLKLHMFILSSNIFTGNTASLLALNNEKYFTVVTVNKGDFVLSQSVANDSVIILKEGCYELTITCSIEGICNIVNFIYSLIKRDKGNRTALPNAMEKIGELAQDITKMNEEERMIKEKQHESLVFDAFYIEKRKFKLFAIASPDYFGFEGLELNDFSLQCLSNKGEFIQICKGRYNSLSMRDKETKANEALFCFQKNEKIIKRLLSIRYSLLQFFLKKNELTFLSKKEMSISKKLKEDPPLSFFLSKSNPSIAMNKAKTLFSIDKYAINGFKEEMSIKRKEFCIKALKQGNPHKRGNRSLNHISNPYYIDNSPNKTHCIETPLNKKPINNVNPAQFKAVKDYLRSRRGNKQSKPLDNSLSVSYDHCDSRDCLFRWSMKSRLICNTPSQFESSINKSISIEHYKEMKESQYRLKRNYYLVKATRDFFLKRKQSIRLCKSKSSGALMKNRSKSNICVNNCR